MNPLSDDERPGYVVEQPVTDANGRIGTCRVYVDTEERAQAEVAAAPPHINRTYRVCPLAEMKPAARENILRARAEARAAQT